MSLSLPFPISLRTVLKSDRNPRSSPASTNARACASLLKSSVPSMSRISALIAIALMSDTDGTPETKVVWYLLEEVLQTQLHNARVRSCSDHPEIRTAHIRVGVQRVEMVRSIEGLNSELHGLRFSDLERSRDPRVNDDSTRSLILSGIAPDLLGLVRILSRGCRGRERGRIQPAFREDSLVLRIHI